MQSELRRHSGRQLKLVQEDDDDGNDGDGGGRRMSGSSFRGQRRVAGGGGALWTELWEFAPFEMQIPGGAERAGETGVRRKCVASGGGGGGGGCEAAQ